MDSTSSPVSAIGAAILSSLAVSPAMTVIDAAVIRAQFHGEGILSAGLKCSKEFLGGQSAVIWRRPWFIMNGVYGFTYGTANLVDYYCKREGIDSSLPVFASTSVVNVTAIAYKDRQFAAIFGSPGSRSVFPRFSIALFAMRDSLTIAASFAFKHDFVQYLHSQYAVGLNQADLIASFAMPMSAQLLSTPLHILALDLYHRPTASFSSRISAILAKYPSVCAGRMFRVIPAFGVGGYLNDVLRTQTWHSMQNWNWNFEF